MHAQAVSQLAPRPVHWLWPGRLALGKLALLEGDPGLGKSLLTLDLCARLSTGQPFPDGSPSPGPAASLLFNAEDSMADTVVPRLRALGADLAHVYRVCSRDDAEDELLSLPHQVDILERLLQQTEARLVVLDPITAFFHSSVQLPSDSSVRHALAPLAALARKYACVILLLRHLNKTGRAQALYRGLGSIGLLGARRSAWLAAPHPDDPRRRVLAQLKNNLAPMQPSLSYQVESHHPDPPTLTWGGPCRWTADELLAGAPSLPRDRARDFLTAFLQAGPRTADEIWEAAQQQGLSERTLRRAKHELRIRSAYTMIAGRRVSYWLLRDQEPPATSPMPTALRDYLHRLEIQYPPGTPLDDL